MTERIVQYPTALPDHEQERIARLTESMLEALFPAPAAGGGGSDPRPRGRRAMRAVALMAACLHAPRGEEEDDGYLGSGHRPGE